MRRLLLASLAFALALTTFAPGAQAAINKPRPFTDDFGYMAGLGSDSTGPMTVVSGDVEATTAGSGSYGFFDSRGNTVSGLTRVCYGTTALNSGCTTGNGPFTLIVSPATSEGGGSFALCFPGATAGEFAAGHVLGIFVDFASDEDLNSFGVDKSLVAPAVDATFTFTQVPNVSGGGALLNQPCSQQGGLTALDDTTTIQLRSGSQSITSLTGKSARFVFTGKADVTPVSADFSILPFGSGAEARFGRASAADAKEGLDLGRVQDLMHKLDGAHQGSSVKRDDSETGGNNTQAFLAGLLNGALLSAPQSDGDLELQHARFVRFSKLAVTGTGGGLDWDGKAYLDVNDGKVAGAKPLVGFWLFKLPWWSYVLWAAALVVFVVRLVLRPNKNHPVWDKFRWIGWVATPVAWVLVFLLWDLEFRNVLGVSVLHGASGQFLLIVALLQVGLLGIIGLMAAGPLKILGRNSAMLAGQGTFMGLAGSVAAIVGFLCAAPYLRSYVGLIVTQVMEKLGG